MCDPAQITAELLRQMIVGDHHDIDLRLMRFCANRLCGEQASRQATDARDALIDEVEVVDLAMMFDAPAGLLRSLRSGAMDRLEQLTRQAQSPPRHLPGRARLGRGPRS